MLSLLLFAAIVCTCSVSALFDIRAAKSKQKYYDLLIRTTFGDDNVPGAADDRF